MASLSYLLHTAVVGIVLVHHVRSVTDSPSLEHRLQLIRTNPPDLPLQLVLDGLTDRGQIRLLLPELLFVKLSFWEPTEHDAPILYDLCGYLSEKDLVRDALEIIAEFPYATIAKHYNAPDQEKFKLQLGTMAIFLLRKPWTPQCLISLEIIHKILHDCFDSRKFSAIIANAVKQLDFETMIWVVYHLMDTSDSTRTQLGLALFEELYSSCRSPREKRILWTSVISAKNLSTFISHHTKYILNLVNTIGFTSFRTYWLDQTLLHIPLDICVREVASALTRAYRPDLLGISEIKLLLSEKDSDLSAKPQAMFNLLAHIADSYPNSNWEESVALNHFMSYQEECSTSQSWQLDSVYKQSSYSPASNYAKLLSEEELNNCNIEDFVMTEGKFRNESKLSSKQLDQRVDLLSKISIQFMKQYPFAIETAFLDLSSHDIRLTVLRRVLDLMLRDRCLYSRTSNIFDKCITVLRSMGEITSSEDRCTRQCLQHMLIVPKYDNVDYSRPKRLVLSLAVFGPEFITPHYRDINDICSMQLSPDEAADFRLGIQASLMKFTTRFAECMRDGTFRLPHNFIQYAPWSELVRDPAFVKKLLEPSNVSIDFSCSVIAAWSNKKAFPPKHADRDALAWILYQLQSRDNSSPIRTIESIGLLLDFFDKRPFSDSGSPNEILLDRCDVALSFCEYVRAWSSTHWQNTDVLSLVLQHIRTNRENVEFLTLLFSDCGLFTKFQKQFPADLSQGELRKVLESILCSDGRRPLEDLPFWTGLQKWLFQQSEHVVDRDSPHDLIAKMTINDHQMEEAQSQNQNEASASLPSTD